MSRRRGRRRDPTADGVVTRVQEPMKRYFASSARQPRARRAVDVTAVVIGASLILWTAVNADRVAAAEVALVDLTRSIPSWFEQVYTAAFFLGFVMVAGLVIAVLGEGKKRLDLLRDIALAIVASLGVGALSIWWLGDPSAVVLFPEFAGGDVSPSFPILRVALLTGAVAVSSPHLSRPVRRFGWTMVVLVAISGFGLGFGFPSDAVGGFGIGLVAASVILLIFGSPRGYPDVSAVSAALSDLGLAARDLRPSSDRSWGVRRLLGELDYGTQIEVKAYGRDATDSQLLTKAWRTLWYREGGQTFNYSRLQSVEHEALALLMAGGHGAQVPEVLAAGLGGDDMALLVTTRRGSPMRDVPLTHDMLVAAWTEVGKLHAAQISHGSLTVDAFAVDNAITTAHDFSSASLNAQSVRVNLDIVSFLYSSAAEGGVALAIGAAVEGIGTDALAAALAFLQTPALTRAQRRQVEKPKKFMVELREAVASAADAELPEPAKLRRVSGRDLVMPALSLVAAYALLSMLTDIDFVAVWDVMQTATWSLVVIGFAIGQTVFFFEASSMLFATGYALPLKPLTILQVSVKWIGLAVPTAAGRVAMNTLFLRKFGVSPTIAVTQGALDGLAGFAVEVLILLVALIVSDVSLDIDTSTVDWGIILLIVIVVIAGSITAITRIAKLRETVLPVLRDAWNLLVGILKDPLRTLGLLGSNLAARTILAITLWFILQAIGAPLPLVTTLIATVATNLLAGLVPIPGGIGVAEAVLTSLLVFAGLDPEEAFAAAIVFRIATFYIPAAEGFFAMRWLERADYL
jgi:uncharacterized membrane protein YbhN (UPF0104 family)/tRNA A-37 threonylcarbamoyl transferase component Bud32